MSKVDSKVVGTGDSKVDHKMTAKEYQRQKQTSQKQNAITK